MFRNLNRTSERFVATNEKLLKPLFLHQQADLHAMMKLEDSQARRLAISERQHFETKIGILSDKPGAGKSYTILALLMNRPNLDNPEVTKSQTIALGGRATIETMRARSILLDTNLILAPRGTLRQWESYMDDMTTCARTECRVFFNMEDRDVDDIYKNKYKIAVVDEMGYRKLTQEDDRISDAFFQRCIVDEADNIRIPSCTIVNAAFVWLLTTSPNHLTRCITPTVAFHRFFDTRIGFNPVLVPHIIVESDPAFVDESLNLPMYTEETMTVMRNGQTSTVKNFVSDDAMHAISCGDVAYAINILGCHTALDEDGMVSTVTANIAREIDSLHRLILVAPIGTSTTTIAARVEGMENKMTMIKDRIRESNCCPIGMEAIDIKACTMCCQNTFEFANLMKAIQVSGKCPLCKAAVAPKGIVAMLAPGHEKSNAAHSNKYLSKAQALEAVLEKIFSRVTDKNPKVIVFSDWDMDMTKHVVNKVGIWHKEVKGNVSVINDIVHQFTNKDLELILLNEARCGAGLNLQAATHIICMQKLDKERYSQLIGRAQRPNRTSSLKVVNIMFSGDQAVPS